MYIRQPIVAVLGHVDHGKTTLLDFIRGSCVAAREAGAITQHIGATEVPIDAIKKLCGKLLHGKKFKVPGLLFIDTPGHFAFTTLRARGGALADLAVLVIDINEGIMPQTEESIEILKKYRTPFVVAANKIDAITGWKKVDGTISQRLNAQIEATRAEFDEKFYKLVEKLYEKGFSAERYDRIRDFTRNVAIVPISAKTGEGIPELLMVLIGLAQKFLEKELMTEEKEAEGTVLEVKEEKGLGTTVDAIIYNGIIREGDKIVLGGKNKPIVTTIRALLKPKPLDEIRDPSDKFMKVKEAHAACGIKIAAPNLEETFAGAPLKVVKNLEEDIKKINKEMSINIETQDEGIILKADAVGSLEAIAFILKERGIPIRKAEVGDISKRDIVEAQTNSNPLNRVVIGFNVKILPEVEDKQDVEILTDKIIYHLLDKLDEWLEKKKKEIEEEQRKKITHPGMIKFLPNYTFRVSKPAIIGVRVIAGEIRPGQKLIRDDGKPVGKIKSIQKEKKSLSKAIQGMEVAVAIDGATVGRQIKPGQIMLVDISQSEIQKLLDMELTPDERDVLEKLIKIKRGVHE
ncbi:MAG TPA: translation initiation factor IF-2 [Thermoplasmatales archaeon]|nr:translation initiation factor IF-2 [Thermoplasmatales archaeon]